MFRGRPVCSDWFGSVRIYRSTTFVTAVSAECCGSPNGCESVFSGDHVAHGTSLSALIHGLAYTNGLIASQSREASDRLFSVRLNGALTSTYLCCGIDFLILPSCAKVSFLHAQSGIYL